MDSLENKGTKFLLNFDASFEKCCNSKLLVDIATARRYGRLKALYIKLNLFHQKEIRRNVELQNTKMLSSSLPVM